MLVSLPSGADSAIRLLQILPRTNAEERLIEQVGNPIAALRDGELSIGELPGKKLERIEEPASDQGMGEADIEVACIVMAAHVSEMLRTVHLDEVGRCRVGQLQVGVAGGSFPVGVRLRERNAAALVIEAAQVSEEDVVGIDVTKAEIRTAT